MNVTLTVEDAKPEEILSFFGKIVTTDDLHTIAIDGREIKNLKLNSQVGHSGDRFSMTFEFSHD